MIILVETINKGGFASVKLALSRINKQQVAIKILTKKMDDCQHRKLIQSQIYIHEKLKHHRIVKLIDVREDQDDVFIIQQYCSGGDLLTKIQNQGPLSYSHANRILCQILQAMIYLKKKGIYHRDIKPENILFDRKGQVKLCDFGLACYCADNQLLDERCGSASYMSPEMAADNQYCPQKSDVWSLGVLYHAMVTGEMLFPGQSNEGAKGQVMRFNMQVPWNVPLKSRKLFKMMIAKQNQRSSLTNLLSFNLQSFYKKDSYNQVQLKKDFKMLQSNQQKKQYLTCQRSNIQVNKIDYNSQYQINTCKRNNKNKTQNKYQRNSASKCERSNVVTIQTRRKKIRSNPKHQKHLNEIHDVNRFDNKFMITRILQKYDCRLITKALKQYDYDDNTKKIDNFIIQNTLCMLDYNIEQLFNVLDKYIQFNQYR